MKEIRTLKASEIECRAHTVKVNGCSLLLYKDARVDMKILDEVFGNENWQRTHEVINGNLFCNIEIWDDTKKCWVKKQDVGTESNTEKEKGQASDSFKRAGINVGIGRELYTAPFIWVSLSDSETWQKGDKYYLGAGVSFSVKEIGYDEDRNINKLVIVDSKGKIRYEMGKKTDAPKPEKSEAEKAFEKALQELSGSMTIMELQTNWAKYPKYQTNKLFLDTKDKLKTQLK
jgi:hypothetical protein